MTSGSSPGLEAAPRTFEIQAGRSARASSCRAAARRRCAPVPRRRRPKGGRQGCLVPRARVPKAPEPPYPADLCVDLSPHGTYRRPNGRNLRRTCGFGQRLRRQCDDEFERRSARDTCAGCGVRARFRACGRLFRLFRAGVDKARRRPRLYPPGRRVAGSPGRRVAGSPGRRVAGSPGRRVAGSPGRRVAGSPGRRVAGSPGRRS